MDRFIRVNGKKFSFEEVARALGVEVAPHLDPVQIHLCQQVDDGVLVAKGAFLDNDDYPAIDLDLELPAEMDSMPVPIFKVEQPRVDGAYSDGYKGVRSFAYNRDGEYFLYTNVDSRSDEIVDRDGMEQRVMVSGSPAWNVEVYQENPYVCFMGEREFKYKSPEPTAEHVSIEHAAEHLKLEVGMVGVLKYDDGIKKALQGRAFRIVEEYPLLEQCAVCSIEGKDGTYMVYAGQMHSVGYPVEVLGDVFETKQVDGHILAEVDREELFKALEQAPVGTVITGVRAAPGSYEYGKYDFDTNIEKHGGYVQNYFAPMATKNYETWWTVGGSKKNMFEMVDIFSGQSKYYALTQVSPSIDDKLNDASRRSREGDKEFVSVSVDKVFE